MSAGVVGTPKILMLSGIGPEKHLRSHGVSEVCELDLFRCCNLDDSVGHVLPEFKF